MYKNLVAAILISITACLAYYEIRVLESIGDSIKNNSQPVHVSIDPIEVASYDRDSIFLFNYKRDTLWHYVEIDGYKLEKDTSSINFNLSDFSYMYPCYYDSLRLDTI